MEPLKEGMANFVATITAGMLLSTGAMLITVGNQQAKVAVQIDSITEKLNTLTDNMSGIETRLRTLETERQAIENSLRRLAMSGAEWFVIGGIIIAAADQILDRSPWKSNNVLQLLLEGLKTVFRVKG